MTEYRAVFQGDENPTTNANRVVVVTSYDHDEGQASIAADKEHPSLRPFPKGQSDSRLLNQDS